MEKSYKTTDTRWVCVLDFMIVLNQLYFAIQSSSGFNKVLSIFNVALWSVILVINVLQCIKIYMEVE